MRGLCLILALLSLRAVAQTAEPYIQQPIGKIEAEYTEEARLAGLEGAVRIRGAIADDGTPRNLQVVESLGLGLDEKAVDAAKRWQFAPDPHHPTLNFTVDFVLPAKRSRWHLTRVVFEPPLGASRPVFLSAKYPLGSGIQFGTDSTPIDEARVVAAVGRQAWAVVSFDLDETGFPRNFEVPDASMDLWKEQAIALVRGWRFAPGMKDGKPIPIRCKLNLVWGARNLSASQLAQARPAESPQREQQSVHPPTVPVQFPPPAPGVARVEASPSEQFDRLIRRVAPVYPPAAMKAGMGGVVLFQVLIGTDGHVQQTLALTPNAAYVREAIQAVMQWVYRPAVVNGEAAEVTTVVPIEVP